MPRRKKTTTEIISCQDLIKTYLSGKIETPVLRGVEVSIKQGEFVAIMGKSGAGKSTLMYQLSALDHPTSGTIVVDGRNLEELSSRERTEFRLQCLGYVFQDYALLPELRAHENVSLPLLMQGYDHDTAYEKSVAALEAVGLGERTDNKPSQLSGGEQQRVSIARAIAHNPKVLFADEPTANLDSVSSKKVLDVFTKLHKEGLTIVMVTHEREYARYAERTIYLKDGEVVSRL